MKSKVLRAVRSALKFRNCSVSLGLPFLAHHSFSTNVQVWLHPKIIHYKHWLIPLQPSSRIVELAQPSVQKLAYNFKHWACLQNDQYRPDAIVLN